MTFHFFKAMFRLAPKMMMENDEDKHHTDTRAINHGAEPRQLVRTKMLAATTCSHLFLFAAAGARINGIHYFHMGETVAPDRAGPNWDTDTVARFQAHSLAPRPPPSTTER